MSRAFFTDTFFLFHSFIINGFYRLSLFLFCTHIVAKEHYQKLVNSSMKPNVHTLRGTLRVYSPLNPSVQRFVSTNMSKWRYAR